MRGHPAGVCCCLVHCLLVSGEIRRIQCQKWSESLPYNRQKLFFPPLGQPLPLTNFRISPPLKEENIPCNSHTPWPLMTNHLSLSTDVPWHYDTVYAWIHGFVPVFTFCIVEFNTRLPFNCIDNCVDKPQFHTIQVTST